MSAKPLFRKPVPEDGASVHNLVSLCPPLDGNSLYCNLLQCTHYAATSVAVDLDQDLSGFVSGYLIPDRPDTLFIWQVAVAKKARGMRLASQMIKHILSREELSSVRFLETTITTDNEASWALFLGLARDLGAENRKSLFFDKERHFRGQHDSENLLHIGPFGIEESKS